MEANIEIDNPRRFLGFNIPGLTPEESLDFFKKNFANEYSQMIQEYTPYTGDELEKANKFKQKALEKTKKTNGGARVTQQAGPTHLKLSPVEMAYYMAYNRGFNPILSDADANKNKQNPVQNEGEDDARLQVKPEEAVQQKVVQSNGPIEQETEQNLCICNRDDGKTMLCCDNCNIWYHLECLGFTKDEAEMILKQGEDELWFHNDQCKAQYWQNNPDGKKE